MRITIWGFLCFYIVFSVLPVSLSDEAIYSNGIYTDPYSSSDPTNIPDNYDEDSKTPETEQLYKTPNDTGQNEDESNTGTDVNPDETPNRRKGSYKVVMKQTYKIREPVSRIVKTKIIRSRPVIHRFYQSRYGYSNPGGALTKIEYTGDTGKKLKTVDGAYLSANPKSIPVDGNIEIEKYDAISDVTKNTPHVEVDMAQNRILRSQNLQNYNALELFNQNYDGVISGEGLLRNSQSYSFPMEPKHLVNDKLYSDSKLINNNKEYYEQVFHKKLDPKLLNTNNYAYNVQSGSKVTRNKYPQNYGSRWYHGIQTMNNDKGETKNQDIVKLNPVEYSTDVSEFGKRLLQVNNYLNNHIPESNKNLMKSIDSDNHQKTAIPSMGSSINFMSKSNKNILKSVVDYDNRPTQPVPLTESSIFTIKYGGQRKTEQEVNNVEEGEPHKHGQSDVKSTTVPPLDASSDDINKSYEHGQFDEKLTIVPPLQDKNDDIINTKDNLTLSEIPQSTITTHLPFATGSGYGHILDTSSDVPDLRKNISIVSTETDEINAQPLEKEGENRTGGQEKSKFSKFTNLTQSRHAIQRDDNTGGQKVEDIVDKRVVNEDQKLLRDYSGESLDGLDGSLTTQVISKENETLRSGRGEIFDRNHISNLPLEKVTEVRDAPGTEIEEINESTTQVWEIAHKIITDYSENVKETDDKETALSGMHSSSVNVLNETNENKELSFGLHSSLGESIESLSFKKVIEINTNASETKDIAGDSSSRLLEKSHKVYSGYGKILNNTNEPKPYDLDNTLYTTNEKPMLTSQKVYEVQTGMADNYYLDKIDDSQNGILKKISNLYSDNGDILYKTNTNDKNNYDLVNTPDKTNETPIVTLQNIYEFNSDANETLDEINDSPNEVVKKPPQDLFVTEKTLGKTIERKLEIIPDVSYNVPEINESQGIYGEAVEMTDLDKHLDKTINDNSEQSTTVSIVQDMNQVLPETKESLRELDILLTESNAIPEVSTEANSAQIEKNINILTDLTKNLMVDNNVPDLLLENEARSHKQAEPEHKTNNFESAWTLLPLDDQETKRDDSVKVPDDNSKYFPNPHYIYEPAKSDVMTDRFPIDDYGYVNDGLKYPEMKALRTQEITYTTVSLPLPNHYVEGNFNKLDDNPDELVQLCKLARTNLHRLRKIVAKNYGLNTKTAEERDLITIVYIMGTLSEARKSDMPVENIIDDLHVNLRRLGELRKMLCKEIDAIDQTVDIGENVETTDGINFDANILSLFDKYLSSKNNIINADYGLDIPDSTPGLVKNIHQTLYTVKPHNLIYTKQDLYITKPDVAETKNPDVYASVDDNNAFVTNLNTQPVKTNNFEKIYQNVYDIEPTKNTHDNLYTIAPDYTDKTVQRLHTITPNYRENHNQNVYSVIPDYVDKVNDEFYTAPPAYTDDIDQKAFTINKNINPVTPVYDEQQSVYEPVHTENIHENLFTIGPDYTDNVVQNLNSFTTNYRIRPGFVNEVGDKLYTFSPDYKDNDDQNAYTLKDNRNPVVYDENLNQNVYDIEPEYKENTQENLFTIEPSYVDNIVQKLYSITPINKQNVYSDIPVYVDNDKLYTTVPDHTDDIIYRSPFTINKNINPVTPVFNALQYVDDINPILYTENTPEILDYTDNIVQDLNYITPNYHVKPGYIVDNASDKLFTLSPDYTDDIDRNASTINNNRDSVTPSYGKNLKQNVYDVEPDYTENAQEFYTVAPKFLANEKQNVNSVKPGYGNDFSDKLMKFYTNLPDYTDDIDTYTIDENKYPDTSVYIDKTEHDVHKTKPGYVKILNDFSLIPKPDYISQHLSLDHTEYFTEKPDYTGNINQNTNTDNYLYTTEPGYTDTDEISQKLYSTNPNYLKNTQNYIYPIKSRLYKNLQKNTDNNNYYSVPDSIELMDEQLFAIKQNKYPLHLDDIVRTNEKYLVESDLDNTNEKIYTTLPNYVEDVGHVENTDYSDNQYTPSLDNLEETHQSTYPLRYDNEHLYTNKPEDTDIQTTVQSNSVDENKNPVREGSIKESLPILYPKRSDFIEKFYSVKPDYIENKNQHLFKPENTKNTKDDFYTYYTDGDNDPVSSFEYPVKQENFEIHNWNPSASGDVVYEPDYTDNYSVNQFKYNVRPDIVRETNQNLYINQPVYMDNKDQNLYPMKPNNVKMPHYKIPVYKIPGGNLYERKPELSENTYDQLYINQPYKIDKTSNYVNQYKNPEPDYLEKINQFHTIDENLNNAEDNIYTNQLSYPNNQPQKFYPIRPFKPVERDQTKDIDIESPKIEQEITTAKEVKLPDYLTNNKYQASPITLTSDVTPTRNTDKLLDVASTATHINKETNLVDDMNKPDMSKDVYLVNDVKKPGQTKDVLINNGNKPDTTKEFYPIKEKNKPDTTKSFYFDNEANKPFDKTSQNYVNINIPIKESTNKPKTYIDIPEDYYKQLLDDLRQYDIVKITEIPKMEYAHDIDIWGLIKKPDQTINWNSDNWFKYYHDTAFKEPEHFNVQFNNKKLIFSTRNNPSVIENVNLNNINIDGYLQKVDLETLVNVAHYQSTSYDSELVALKELSLLLEVRDKIDITIVTNVIWNEILRLRLLGASEESINRFVKKLITTVLPYAFRDTQKCHSTILRHLLTSIKQLENNEL